MNKHLRSWITLLLMMVAGTMWGETSITYTFTTKNWNATPDNWKSEQNGNEFINNRGVQVTTGTSRAGAKSPISFNNIKKIELTYSTNAKSGAGSIGLKVGENEEIRKTITKTGGTSDRLITFDYDELVSGVISFTVYCTTNSIYIKSITITYDDNEETVSKPSFSVEEGEVDRGTVVTFDCETENVTYYFTTDGSTPTTESATGTSFTINNDVTLKVIAVKEGMQNSAVATASYTIRKNNPNLLFSDERVTAYIGEPFTAPTLTYADDYDGVITFSSSNSAISVDPATGAVTFNESAAGKTTTITATASATDNFNSESASYVLEVINPNAIEGNLNNATFGTSYNGSLQGNELSSFISVSGKIGDVTVTYGKGSSSNAYINDTQIRLYNGSTLSFTAPDGYVIASLAFNTELSSCSADYGTITGNIWSAGEAQTANVTITKESTGNLQLSTVSITLVQTSSVAKPTISPVSGTYTEAQTVTITNHADGASVYYTTNGSTPTEESAKYSQPFMLSHNGTYTIKAIAISDEGKSAVAKNIIIIKTHVEEPVFTEVTGTTFTEPYTIHLTATEGCTIYYAMGGESPVDANGQLTGASVAYNSTNGIANLSKATTITAVAVDTNGNVSDAVSASYHYNGEVSVPFYENFDEGLGNFTVESSGTTPPEWVFDIHNDQDFIDKYGEARKYAKVAGNGKEGTTRLVSPIIDLTEDGLESITLNFIHAGHWFGTRSSSTFYPNETIMRKECHLCVKKTDEASWTDISDKIVNWFDQILISGSGGYPRKNSGDIDLSEYIGSKIQISFFFDVSSENVATSDPHGTWNVLKFALTSTKEDFEIVNKKDANGYLTYVVKNDIDWTKTLERNGKDGIDVHGYKVTEFTQESAAFAEFGVGDNEDFIPAGTPIIVKVKTGENRLVIAKTDDVIAKVKNNLLRPSDGNVTATDGQRLLVFQKSSAWKADDPYNNYGFFKLKTGRLIPEGKAYLNGIDVKEELTATTQPAKGIFLLEDLLSGMDEVSPVTTSLRGDAIRRSAEQTSQPVVYDLSGRRVAIPTESLSKGMYIMNGRKVVVR